jgi:SAM-dependent methyltransferase
VLDYTLEADRYDATRGGEERAAAAAQAIEELLPAGTGTVVDLACGTGIVTRRLLAPSRRVLGVDRSAGMLVLASGRLPGVVIGGDATRLPLESASVDAVVLIWLLHLLTDAEPVLAEAARVLRPGGVLISTVDKNQAAFTVPSDVAAVTQHAREAYTRSASDRRDRVVAEAAGHGLRPVSETSFVGAGQGRSPRQWQEEIRSNRIPWSRGADHMDADPAAALCRALAALPDQERRRPDPVYQLIALAAQNPRDHALRRRVSAGVPTDKP